MNLRRFLAEAGALAALAILCALVSNGLAGKDRRLTLPGDYPNATRVTEKTVDPPVDGVEADPAVPGPAVTDEASQMSPETVVGEKPPAAKVPNPAVPATPRAPVKAAPPAPSPASHRADAPKGPASPAELLARFPPHGTPSHDISGPAAAWLHDRGALFLDARRSRDFAQGHIAGARSFPVWESELVKERIERFVTEGHDPALPIVLYCSGGDCEDSHMLAQMLFGAGFENLLVYRDGFPDWVARGGKVGVGGAA